MRTCTTISVMASVLLFATASAAQPLGVFTDHSDVGKPSTIGPGSASYDPATKTYTIAGGGENMWAAADHFHYVWKKMSGDVTLEADIAFVATRPESGTPNGHRKACLVLRQTLDADSVYADAATHGDGLTSLQWREAKGGVTHEVQSMMVKPGRLRVEKRGSYVSMAVAAAGEPFQPAGGAARVELTGEFYVGLAVSSHDTARIETATFSNVTIGIPPARATAAPDVASMTTLVNTLETINVRSKDRRVAYVVTQPGRIEAPNWFPDATNTLYFNNGGRLYKVQADPPGATRNPNRLATPEPVELGMLNRINNDHGVTRDGTTWAISDQSQTMSGRRPSLIYTVPVAGGAPRRVTEKGPSYFHGWSPDGKTLTYCGERDGNFDVYTIPVEGGEEKRLTTDKGKDDGPEYSPDGQYIYFNSDRSGTMQVWRMKADGTGQEQMTNDEYENNVASWSPNSQYLAFVSYQIVPR
jgi:TolB protein